MASAWQYQANPSRQTQLPQLEQRLACCGVPKAHHGADEGRGADEAVAHEAHAADQRLRVVYRRALPLALLHRWQLHDGNGSRLYDSGWHRDVECTQCKDARGAAAAYVRRPAYEQAGHASACLDRM